MGKFVDLTGQNNLEIKTNAENQKNRKTASNNTSGKQGVYWETKGGKWRSVIGVRGEKIQLGSYIEKQDAINARLEAEIKYGFIGE